MEKDNRKIGVAIRHLHKAFQYRFMTEGTEVGLDEVTMMHGWVMGYLRHNEDKEIYQKSLESNFGIRRSSVTSIVKIMESKGYIKRTAVPGDARLKKLELTDLGRNTADKAKNTLDSMEKSMVQGISKEDLEVFFRVADQICQNLDKDYKTRK